MSTVANVPKGKLVAGTESKVLAEAASNDREGVYITNDGGQTVYIALGPVAAVGEGIRLNANGGSAVVTDFGGPISAITPEGTSLVTFSEV